LPKGGTNLVLKADWGGGEGWAKQNRCGVNAHKVKKLRSRGRRKAVTIPLKNISRKECLGGRRPASKTGRKGEGRPPLGKRERGVPFVLKRGREVLVLKVIGSSGEIEFSSKKRKRHGKKVRGQLTI